jgi:hypothetical protein
VTEFRKQCLEKYRAFAKENAGTGAGDRAEDLVKTFEGLLPAEAVPDTPPDEGKKK